MIIADRLHSSALDPTMQVLLTIFGAALVTAAAGFVVAYIQGRREHGRWVMQQRFAVYQEVLALANEALDIDPSTVDGDAEVAKAVRRIDRKAKVLGSRLSLIGPRSVADAWDEVRGNLLRPDFGSVDNRHDAIMRELDMLRHAMRKGVKVFYDH